MSDRSSKLIGVTLAAWTNGLLEAPIPTGAALGTLTLGAGIYVVGRRLGWFMSPAREA